MSLTPRNVRSCPSARPEMQGAVVFGVLQPSLTEPQVAYLKQVVPVTNGLLASTGAANPAEVLRFASACQESRCQHFDGTDCRLATRLVQILPAVVDALPRCAIRTTCRWFLQEGRQACLRCPQVASEIHFPSPDLLQAATPE